MKAKFWVAWVSDGVRDERLVEVPYSTEEIKKANLAIHQGSGTEGQWFWMPPETGTTRVSGTEEELKQSAISYVAERLNFYRIHKPGCNSRTYGKCDCGALAGFSR